MTIKEAIEELNRGTRQSRSTNNQRLREALRLGVEALKRCQYIAAHTDRWASVLLPGETPE